MRVDRNSDLAEMEEIELVAPDNRVRDHVLVNQCRASLCDELARYKLLKRKLAQDSATHPWADSHELGLLGKLGYHRPECLEQDKKCCED